MALTVGELVAYLQLDESRYRAGLAAAEQAAGASLRRQEQAMGESGAKQASALSSRLRTGVVAGAAAAGTAGAAAFGTAIKLGFDRLTAIDNAKGKLRGLGHDMASQTKIMDSALASVKGTAFGLGDAATISASAVAAGIKPGQELTKYLKSTADAATIAGSSLSEMGSVFNQVQTGQRAYTDDLNQLADRGIPIYQWLGREMGVAAGEVKELASKGKVSSEVFFAAIQKNIAGAALESGKTVTGSFNNVKAALGRLGAAALEPGFNRLPRTFTSITASIDAATPKAKALATALDAKMFDQWAPAAQKAWQSLAATPAVRQNFAEVSALVGSLAQTAQTAWPPLVQIGSSLAQASGSLGVSSWRLFLTALEAAAGALNIVVGALQPIANLMSSNQAAVTAAVGAWLLFKTVPGVLANLRTGMASVRGATEGAVGPVQRLGAGIATLQGGVSTLGGHMNTARGGISNFTQSYRDLVRWTGQANTTISPMGRILFGTGDSARTASTHLRAMGSVASSAASSGMSALKAGATGVVGALGGPFSAALMAAGIAFAAISAKNQQAAQSMQAYEQATKRVAEAQVSLDEALMKSRGSASDEGVKSAGVDRMAAYRKQLEAEAERTGSVWDRARNEQGSTTLGSILTSTYGGGTGQGNSRADVIDRQANSAREAVAALDGLKRSQQSLADVTYGSQGAFDALVAKLNASGDAGRRVAGDMQKARAEFQQQQAAAQKVAPGITELSKAMQVLGDKTATAADKSSALKAALDALNPARTLGDAVAAHDKTLQQVAQSTQEAADRTKGFGAELIGVGGAINTTKANGNDLRDALKGIVDASVEAAAKGQPVGEVNAKNAAAFQQLATQYGLSVEQIQQAYNTLGGKDLTMVVRLAGAPEAAQKIAEVARAFEATPDAKTITLRTNDIAGVQEQLRGLKFTVDDLPDGTTTITANTSEAKQRLSDIQRIIVSDIPPDKAININAPGGQAVLDLLRTLGVTTKTLPDGTVKVTSPMGQDVLALLEKLGVKVQTLPDGTIRVKQLGAKEAGIEIDQAAKDRNATIRITTINDATAGGYKMGDSLPGGGVFRGPGIAQNSDGAIRSLRAFADGGFRYITKPQSADIYAGRGAGTVFAEKETGDEAYIPLAPSKRLRSMRIWMETGRRLGAFGSAFGAALAMEDGGILSGNRDAQRRIRDAEQRVTDRRTAVDQAKQRQTELTDKAKKSQVDSAANAITKAERELADAETDLADLRAKLENAEKIKGEKAAEKDAKKAAADAKKAQAAEAGSAPKRRGTGRRSGGFRRGPGTGFDLANLFGLAPVEPADDGPVDVTVVNWDEAPTVVSASSSSDSTTSGADLTVGATGAPDLSGPREAYGLPAGTSISYGQSDRFPQWVREVEKAFGVQASTYAGHQEKDGKNKGIDWSGDPVNLQRLADYLASIPGAMEQVIYSNPTTGKKTGVADGKLVGPGTDQPGYYGDDWAGHANHLHSRQSQAIPLPGATPAPAGVPQAPATAPVALTATSSREQIAAAILAEGKRRGLQDAEAQAVLATALQESGLNPTANGGDQGIGGALGLFQQGNSYGPTSDRTDPSKAIAAFYGRLGETQGDIWNRIVAVQQHGGGPYQGTAGDQKYMAEIRSKVAEAQALAGTAGDAATAAASTVSDATAPSAAASTASTGTQDVRVINWPTNLGGTDTSATPAVRFSLFANGGIEDHTAHITDRLRVFGEPETGGEAYIPLAPGKRARSLAIWQQTGRRLGAYANGGISLPKIEAPKIDLAAPALGPGMSLPLTQPAPAMSGAPQVVPIQEPATIFDGGKYAQQRLMQFGVDMLGIAKDAAVQTLVPGGQLPSILTNSVGLAKSVGDGIRTSQQNQAGQAATTSSSESGGRTIINNTTINATNTDDAMRQWQTKQNRDALAFEGKLP